MKKNDAVLVTTAHRGVFFGYFDHQDGNSVCLTKCRNCIYWPEEVKGFIGLATTGPLEGSRVGPAAAKMTLYGVTAIALVSPEAVELWESGPWK